RRALRDAAACHDLTLLLARPPQEDRVPAGGEAEPRATNAARGVAPAQLDVQRIARRGPPQPEMEVERPLAGMPVAAVDLSARLAAPGQLDPRRGPDGGSAGHIRPGMPRSGPRRDVA